MSIRQTTARVLEDGSEILRVPTHQLVDDPWVPDVPCERCRRKPGRFAFGILAKLGAWTGWRYGYCGVECYVAAFPPGDDLA